MLEMFLHERNLARFLRPTASRHEINIFALAHLLRNTSGQKQRRISAMIAHQVDQQRWITG